MPQKPTFHISIRVPSHTPNQEKNKNKKEVKTLYIVEKTRKQIFRLAGQSCFNANFKPIGEKEPWLCELAIEGGKRRLNKLQIIKKD